MKIPEISIISTESVDLNDQFDLKWVSGMEENCQYLLNNYAVPTKPIDEIVTRAGENFEKLNHRRPNGRGVM